MIYAFTAQRNEFVFSQSSLTMRVFLFRTSDARSVPIGLASSGQIVLKTFAFVRSSFPLDVLVQQSSKTT